MSRHIKRISSKQADQIRLTKNLAKFAELVEQFREEIDPLGVKSEDELVREIGALFQSVDEDGIFKG